MSIERINDLSKALTAARAVLAQEQKHLNTLLMQDGQSLAEVHFCGHKVALTYLDRLTGYFPRRVPGRQALLDAVIAAQRDFVIGAAGKVEGLEFQLKQAAKELAGSASNG